MIEIMKVNYVLEKSLKKFMVKSADVLLMSINLLSLKIPERFLVVSRFIFWKNFCLTIEKFLQRFMKKQRKFWKNPRENTWKNF